MGSIFAEEILELERPEVRLLSIGEEPEKGNQLTLEAHALLAASELAFAGNVESRDLLAGAADVVVCDGFTGNVALKLLEGTIKTVLDSLRAEIAATPRGKLGGLLIRPAARRLRTRLDPDTYGGAYLLGLRGLSVIAHGNSSRAAIANAIRLAARGVDHDVVGRLASRLPERRTPASV
jgi:glycerol-3-phosphate acyltransferase PlsX